jgi:hypothetical protein
MFESGESGNKRGRPPGSQNKVSAELRQSISDFLVDNVDEVRETWKELKPQQKLMFWRDLLRYTVPVLQSTEIISDFERMSDGQLRQVIDELKEAQSNGKPK